MLFTKVIQIRFERKSSKQNRAHDGVAIPPKMRQRGVKEHIGDMMELSEGPHITRCPLDCVFFQGSKLRKPC